MAMMFSTPAPTSETPDPVRQIDKYLSEDPLSRHERLMNKLKILTIADVINTIRESKESFQTLILSFRDIYNLDQDEDLYKQAVEILFPNIRFLEEKNSVTNHDYAALRILNSFEERSKVEGKTLIIFSKLDHTSQAGPAAKLIEAILAYIRGSYTNELARAKTKIEGMKDQIDLEEINNGDLSSLKCILFLVR